MRPTTPQNNSVKTPVESLKAPALKQARAELQGRFEALPSETKQNNV